MDTKCELLAKELRGVSAGEVKSLSNHFDACEHRAAAYIMGRVFGRCLFGLSRHARFHCVRYSNALCTPA